MTNSVVLFNPFAGGGKGEESAHKLDQVQKDTKLIYTDMTKITDYKAFFQSVSPEQDLILCGGDGSLNHFLNDTKDVALYEPAVPLSGWHR